MLASGDHRQTFEGGAIQYTPGSGPVVRLPVASVSLGTFSGTQKMNAGDTMTVTGQPRYTAGGAALTDRPFTWSTIEWAGGRDSRDQRHEQLDRYDQGGRRRHRFHPCLGRWHRQPAAQSLGDFAMLPGG